MSDKGEGLVFNKGRLETLTDGIFAVIMTILVFNVSVPELILYAEGELTSGELTSGRLLERLLELWPDIVAYVVSFVTLSVYWLAHHRIFRWIVDVDRRLIWINISLLITIGLIPFSTGLLAQYRDQQISALIYSFNSILAGAIIYFLYQYTKWHQELVDKTVSTVIRSRSGRRVLITILTYSVAILTSFTNLSVTLFLFLLVLIPEFIPDRYFGSDKQFQSDG
jgi:uncharacterized membrane protein